MGEERSRSWLVLVIAAIPVLGFFGLHVWAAVGDARDDERWEEIRTEAVLQYGDRTEVEVDAAGSAWGWTGTWPLPLPDGLIVLGYKGAGADSELVLVSTDLSSERCLLLAFDDEGMRADNDISCQAYRASAG